MRCWARIEANRLADSEASIGNAVNKQRAEQSRVGYDELLRRMIFEDLQ